MIIAVGNNLNDMIGVMWLIFVDVLVIVAIVVMLEIFTRKTQRG